MSTSSPNPAPKGDPTPADDAAMQVLSKQGAQCGACGDEPGDRTCPDCERCRSWYVKALREAGWAPRDEVLRDALARLRRLRAMYPVDSTEEWKRRHGCGLTDAVVLVETMIRAAEAGEELLPVPADGELDTAGGAR